MIACVLSADDYIPRCRTGVSAPTQFTPADVGQECPTHPIYIRRCRTGVSDLPKTSRRLFSHGEPLSVFDLLGDMKPVRKCREWRIGRRSIPAHRIRKRLQLPAEPLF